MADLIAIGYPDEATAVAAADQARRPTQDLIIQPDTIAVIVLLVAGIGSLYPLKQWETGILLIFLTLFNAVLGLRQEGKATAAVAALQQMMIVKAKVRRDSKLAEIAAKQLVPGDVVSIEAGEIRKAARRRATADAVPASQPVPAAQSGA